MNFSDIKNSLRLFLKIITAKLKETLRLPYAKTYLITSIFLILIFTLFTFPFEILLKNQLQKLEKSMVKSIFVGNIYTSLTDITTIDKIHTTLKSGNVLNLKNISINPNLNPYRIFINNKIQGSFEISRLIYTSQSSNMDLSINGNIDLEMISGSSGVKNGHIKLIIQNAKIKIEEFNIPTKLGPFSLKLPILKITSINFESTIKNKTLNLNKFNISGPDIRGSVKGTITLATFIRNSKINLTFYIDPESRVLSSYKELLLNYRDKTGKIKIPVKGTISHPRVNLSARPAIKKPSF